MGGAYQTADGTSSWNQLIRGPAWVGLKLSGTLIIGVVNNGLNLLPVPQGPQRMVTGAIFILAVCVDLLRTRGRR